MASINWARLTDVLKATWVYKLRAADDRHLPPEFYKADIRTVAFSEGINSPEVSVALADGRVMRHHPAELRMRELEELTSWVESRGARP